MRRVEDRLLKISFLQNHFTGDSQPEHKKPLQDPKSTCGTYFFTLRLANTD